MHTPPPKKRRVNDRFDMAMTGIRITDADALAAAAKNKQSVVSKWFCSNPKPAAFVLNMSFVQVTNALKCGMWIYKKPTKQPKP